MKNVKDVKTTKAMAMPDFMSKPLPAKVKEGRYDNVTLVSYEFCQGEKATFFKLVFDIAGYPLTERMFENERCNPVIICMEGLRSQLDEILADKHFANYKELVEHIIKDKLEFSIWVHFAGAYRNLYFTEAAYDRAKEREADREALIASAKASLGLK